jgi:hypothetical protein
LVEIHTDIILQIELTQTSRSTDVRIPSDAVLIVVIRELLYGVVDNNPTFEGPFAPAFVPSEMAAFPPPPQP